MWRSLVCLYWMIFNSLFLCHFFIVLTFKGEYLVREPSTVIAAFEVILTLSLAVLGIERLINIIRKGEHHA